VQYFEEIDNCVSQGIGPAHAITSLKTRLNALVPVSEQQSVELIIKDRSNRKAQNGILQELCYNYFEIDDETFGCRVSPRRKVQIFYENKSPQVDLTFSHLAYYAQLAPFESVAEFEFIPYGATQWNGEQYICHEGEDQCQSNWLHACILKQRYQTLDDQYQFFRFFVCADDYAMNAVNKTEECVRLVYEDGENFLIALRQCADTDLALREEMRNKTEAIGQMTSTPDIYVDGVNKTAEMGALMLIELCRSFEPIKPRACLEIDAANQPVQVTVYLTANIETQHFVQSQIKPLVSEAPRDPRFRLRDVIEWQFIPWGPTNYNETTGELECINDNGECLANRVLACATKQRQNGKLTIREDKFRVASFVACFFDSPSWQLDPLKAASECVLALSPLNSYPQLWQCVVQDVKLQVLLDMKKLTENNYPPIVKCKL